MSKLKIVMGGVLILVLSSSYVYAGKADAGKWINNEFQPSTLSKSEQKAEMDWFIKAAAPFKGMEIN
ncbi:uncharacterized protein METZ01_LOCUS469120, partial [marine metagenome]